MAAAPEFAYEQIQQHTARFINRYNEKYIRGQIEHGTNLHEDFDPYQMLDMLEEEVLDMWAYLCALRYLLKGSVTK